MRLPLLASQPLPPPPPPHWWGGGSSTPSGNPTVIKDLGTNEDGIYQGAANTDTTFKGTVGADDDKNELKDTDQITGGQGGDNTLKLDLSSDWTGFKDPGKAENIQNLDLTANSDSPLSFDATGISGTNDVNITNGDKGPISVSLIPTTATNVTVDQLSTSSPTEISYADPAEGEEAGPINITATGNSEGGDAEQTQFGKLKVDSGEATEVTMNLTGGVDLAGSDLSKVDTLNLNLTDSASEGEEPNRFYATDEGLLSNVSDLTVAAGGQILHMGTIGGAEIDKPVNVDISDAGGVHIAAIDSNGQDVTGTITGDATSHAFSIHDIDAGDGNVDLTVNGGGGTGPIAFGYANNPATPTEPSKVGAITGKDVTLNVSGAQNSVVAIDATGKVDFTSSGAMSDNLTVENMAAAGSTINLGEGADTLTLTKVTGSNTEPIPTMTVDFGKDNASDLLDLGVVDGKTIIKVQNFDEGKDGIISDTEPTGVTGEGETAQQAASELLASYGITADPSKITLSTLTYSPAEGDSKDIPNGVITVGNNSYWHYGDALIQIPGEGADAPEDNNITLKPTDTTVTPPIADADAEFNAVTGTGATLSPTMTINGNAGKQNDLNVEVNGDFTGMTTGSASNITALNLTAGESFAAAATFNAQKIDGIQTVSVINTANSAISATNLPSTAADVEINHLNATNATTVGYSASPTTLNLTVEEAPGGAARAVALPGLILNAAATQTLNLDVTGGVELGASSVLTGLSTLDLTLASGAFDGSGVALNKLANLTATASGQNVSFGTIGDSAANLNANITAATFDATAINGKNLTIKVSDAADATLVASGTIAYTGGSGVDSITASFTAAGSKFTMGAGDDTLVLNSITGAAVASTVEVVLGDGADTLNIGKIAGVGQKAIVKVTDFDAGDQIGTATGGTAPVAITGEGAAQRTAAIDILKAYGITKDADGAALSTDNVSVVEWSAGGSKVMAGINVAGGDQYAQFGDVLVQLVGKGQAVTPLPGEGNEITLNDTDKTYGDETTENTTFIAVAGGSDATLLPETTITGKAAGGNTLKAEVAGNFELTSGKISGVQTIDLTATAAAATFSGAGITGADTINITNGTKGPISLSDLGADVATVSIDAINSTNATTLAWDAAATGPLAVEVAEATATGATANLAINADGAIELTVNGAGAVVLDSDSNLAALNSLTVDLGSTTGSAFTYEGKLGTIDGDTTLSITAPDSTFGNIQGAKIDMNVSGNCNIAMLGNSSMTTPDNPSTEISYTAGSGNDAIVIDEIEGLGADSTETQTIKFDLGAGADSLTLTTLMAHAGGDGSMGPDMKINVDFGADEEADTLTVGGFGGDSGAYAWIAIENFESGDKIEAATGSIDAITTEQAKTLLEACGIAVDESKTIELTSWNDVNDASFTYDGTQYVGIGQILVSFTPVDADAAGA